MRNKSGNFTFITGPMFSGKTEELLRIIKWYQIAGKTIAVYKPKTDTRYGSNIVSTHAGKSVTAKEINTFFDILVDIANEVLNTNSYNLPEAVFIDEVQFLNFDKYKTDLFRVLYKHGINLYVSGLVLDRNNDVFPVSEKLLPYATSIVKLEAVCDDCGCFNAIYTHSSTEGKEQILLGGKEIYKAICSNCYSKTLETGDFNEKK